MADPQPVSGISVVIGDDDDGGMRVDPVTGTVETDQEDGGVVVQLDAHRKKDDDEEDGFYENLVDKIPAARLSVIANDLHEQISADERSRGNYLETRKRGIDLL